jgi:hypothetical protein
VMPPLAIHHHPGIGWSCEIDSQTIVAAAPSFLAMCWRVFRRLGHFRRATVMYWEQTPHGATWRVRRGLIEQPEPQPNEERT